MAMSGYGADVLVYWGTQVSTAVPVSAGNPMPVTGSLSIDPTTSATGTQSSVNDSASSVTLLALNASRKGFIIFNDSTEILYVKFGATATTSDFAAKLQPGDYYEPPAGFAYTGRIDGIWANNASGAARITEFT